MSYEQTCQHSTGALPAKMGSRVYRCLRWNLDSVYRRIFTLAFLANIVTIAVFIAQTALDGVRFTYQGSASAVAANLLAGLLIRNEHVVNTLFLVFGTWTKDWPLPCRKLFANVYSYGGIHSGCGIAATLWCIAFLVQLTTDERRSIIQGYVFLVSYAILFILVTIVTFAHPRIRIALHNWFEGTHRFLGWAVVLLFWVLVLLLAGDTARTVQPATPYGAALVATPTFWMLLCITGLVIYSWTRLRIRDVEVEPLSSHCVKLNFTYAETHYGQAVRLTDAPLKETHAFAAIPNPVLPAAPRWPSAAGTADTLYSSATTPAATTPSTEKPNPVSDMDAKDSGCPGAIQTTGLSNAGRKGFSVVVSDAGDWTRKIIARPPSRIYTRGVPQYGVLRIAGLFSPCIVMATGSGIGPCLSLFVEKPSHPVRVIWSAPSPLETYGQGILDTIYAADPQAVVIDTRKTGRPDLVKIAWGVWEASRSRSSSAQQPDGAAMKNAGPCEAVVVISNQKVTRKVVYGLESRGLPAYGAIFDS